MANWLFWTLLGAMLFAGHAAGAGLFLGYFAGSAIAAALCALLPATGLEEQLHLFLMATAVQLLWVRRRRRRREAAS